MSFYPGVPNTSPQWYRGSGREFYRYDGRLTALFVLLFFMPYWPGTPFRIDQFIGIIYLVFFVLSLYSSRVIAGLDWGIGNLAMVAFWAIVYISTRIILDGKFDAGTAKIFNYQIYFAAGLSIFIFHRKRLIQTKDIFVNAILMISIPISLFALFQFYFTDHYLVTLLLEWYGGHGDAAYASEYTDLETLAAIEVLSKTSMTSIFTGKHSLAVFDLFVIALAVGAHGEGNRTRNGRYFLKVVIVLALISGWLSTSKIFFFGIAIFFVLALDVGRLMAKAGTIALGVCFGLVSLTYFSEEMRVLNDLVELVLSGNIFEIFSSRFGGGTDVGYLGDKMEILFEPLTLFLGQGAWAGKYSLSDSQFRSALLIGGIPYFLLIYGFVIYLLILNWRARHELPYARPFFALGMAYLIGGTGIECYWQARTVPLWIVANLLLAVPQRANRLSG